ncbi:FadR/GntR family transcriptional regulator [Egicoccus sp. AB-alg6-2]|uniref:FadR/GntR family transcriptional regulator n=1 Tax=Egicoccus sp. AB-alg6-2 TaxID=3242692 RepID=UPI00359CF562
MSAPVTTELFTKVSTGRASADVVAQIHAALQSGQLSPGDRLPPERELAAQLGVSRVTVRDALRVLEANGLVAIRVGAHGGAFVTAPEPDHVSEGLANLLMMSQVSPADITEARMVFELGALKLVCERATSDDLAALTEICDRSEHALRQGTFDVALSAEFHIRLAQSSHNVAISLVTEAFQEPMLRSLVKAKAIDPHMGDPGVHEHRRLVAAIADGDVRGAKRVMRQHLGRTAQRIRSEKPARRTPRADGMG